MAQAEALQQQSENAPPTENGSDIRVFRLEGVFRQQIDEGTYPFFAGLMFDVSAGRFFGKMSDLVGSAMVVGHATQKDIEFEKCYDLESHSPEFLGNPEVINYKFKKMNGSWFGNYSYMSGLHEVSGRSVLSRFSEVDQSEGLTVELTKEGFEKEYAKASERIADVVRERREFRVEKARRKVLKEEYLKAHPADGKGLLFANTYLIQMFVLAKSDYFYADDKKLHTALAELKLVSSSNYPSYLSDLNFRYLKGKLFSKTLRSAVNHLVESEWIVPSQDMTRFSVPQDVRDDFLASANFRHTYLGENSKTQEGWEVARVFRNLVEVFNAKLGIPEEGKESPVKKGKIVPEKLWSLPVFNTKGEIDFNLDLFATRQEAREALPGEREIHKIAKIGQPMRLVEISDKISKSRSKK